MLRHHQGPQHLFFAEKRMVNENLQGWFWGPENEEVALTYKAAASKPPLLGEVARWSRDGGVSGLCYVAIPGFFPRLKAQSIEATPQAQRASSTHKGMATHTQLKLRLQSLHC